MNEVNKNKKPRDQEKKLINKNYGSIFGDHISLPVYFLSIFSSSLWFFGSSSKCATVMTKIKRNIYANLYCEKQQTFSCVFFRSYQGSNTIIHHMAKVYNFRAIFLEHTEVVLLSNSTVLLAYTKAGHSCHAFFRHPYHMVQTHMHRLIYILLSVSDCHHITLIHSFIFHISRRHTHIHRHTASCIMKFSIQFA